MTWTIITIALLGTILNARRKWQGFLLWFVSNAWLCVHNFTIGEYAQASLFGVYWFLAVYGICCWRKKDQIGRPPKRSTPKPTRTNSYPSHPMEEE